MHFPLQTFLLFPTIKLFLLLQLTLHAKKAAEEASKQALEVSKQAAGVSKNTLEDLTYVGKSTLGDLSSKAKEAATKKGLMKHGDHQYPAAPATTLVSQKQSGIIQGTGRDFFSSIGTDLNGIASSTSTMFSDLFGGKSNFFKIYFSIAK